MKPFTLPLVLLALLSIAAGPPAGEVQRLIELLGDDVFDVREKADRDLLKLEHKSSMPLAQAGMTHADPEIRHRAARIFKTIHAKREMESEIAAAIFADTTARQLAELRLGTNVAEMAGNLARRQARLEIPRLMTRYGEVLTEYQRAAAARPVDPDTVRALRADLVARFRALVALQRDALQPFTTFSMAKIDNIRDDADPLSFPHEIVYTVMQAGRKELKFVVTWNLRTRHVVVAEYLPWMPYFSTQDTPLFPERYRLAGVGPNVDLVFSGTQVRSILDPQGRATESYGLTPVIGGQHHDLVWVRTREDLARLYLTRIARRPAPNLDALLRSVVNISFRR